MHINIYHSYHTGQNKTILIHLHVYCGECICLWSAEACVLHMFWLIPHDTLVVHEPWNAVYYPWVCGSFGLYFILLWVASGQGCCAVLQVQHQWPQDKMLCWLFMVMRFSRRTSQNCLRTTVSSVARRIPRWIQSSAFLNWRISEPGRGKLPPGILIPTEWNVSISINMTVRNIHPFIISYTCLILFRVIGSKCLFQAV